MLKAEEILSAGLDEYCRHDDHEGRGGENVGHGNKVLVQAEHKGEAHSSPQPSVRHDELLLKPVLKTS